MKKFLFAQAHWTISPLIFILLLCLSGCDPLNDRNSRIIFLSDSATSNREFDICMYDLTNKKSINLTGALTDMVITSTSYPKLNHNRNSVLFLSHRPRELVELKLDTRQVKNIAPISMETANFIISPNGEKIISAEKMNSMWQLYLITLETGEKINLSDNLFNNFEPCYSNDGKQVVYVCDQNGSNSIAIMNADGSKQKILTNNFGDDRYPNISNDGRRIVFSSSRGGRTDSDYDLYMIDSTGENLQLFFDDKSFVTKPVFSPDNRFIAFNSNARGQLYRDIYLIALDTGDIQNITAGLKYFCQNYVFSQDDRSIVFENTKPSDSDIVIYARGTKKMFAIPHQRERFLTPSI